MNFGYLLILIMLPLSFVAFIINHSINKFLEFNKNLESSHIIMETRKQIIPGILQALERITLMLERISPNSIIFRVSETGDSAEEFHHKLLNNIRMEFEHNLSQQVYLSIDTWNHVVLAKEEITSLVNKTAMEIPQGSSGHFFAQQLIGHASDNGLKNLTIAKKKLNQELLNLYAIK